MRWIGRGVQLDTRLQKSAHQLLATDAIFSLLRRNVRVIMLAPSRSATVHFCPQLRIFLAN